MTRPSPGYFKLSRTTAPTEMLVSLAEAREQLRVDTTGSPAVAEDDDIITLLIAAITSEIDAGTGWLGRALAPQSWTLQLAQMPRRIHLPYPPLISVTSFTYVDLDGNTQTMVEGVDFRVINSSGITAGPAILEPLYQQTWPFARSDFDTVTVVFQCGYGTGSPVAASIPEIIKRYVLSALTVAYDTRDVETGQATLSFQKMPEAVRNSLEGFRVRNQFYR